MHFQIFLLLFICNLQGNKWFHNYVDEEYDFVQPQISDNDLDRLEHMLGNYFEDEVGDYEEEVAFPRARAPRFSHGKRRARGKRPLTAKERAINRERMHLRSEKLEKKIKHLLGRTGKEKKRRQSAVSVTPVKGHHMVKHGKYTHHDDGLHRHYSSNLEQNVAGTHIHTYIGDDLDDKGLSWTYKIGNPYPDQRMYWCIVPDAVKAMYIDDIVNGVHRVSPNCYGEVNQLDTETHEFHISCDLQEGNTYRFYIGLSTDQHVHEQGIVIHVPVATTTREPTRITTTYSAFGYIAPTVKPTPRPSLKPTRPPSFKPTTRPTKHPTTKPTHPPSFKPTLGPTQKPTIKPTMKPTNKPTTKPTKLPTSKPTKPPTLQPTKRPTLGPTTKPSNRPTLGPTDRTTDHPKPPPGSIDYGKGQAGTGPTGGGEQGGEGTVIAVLDIGDQVKVKGQVGCVVGKGDIWTVELGRPNAGATFLLNLPKDKIPALEEKGGCLSHLPDYQKAAEGAHRIDDPALAYIFQDDEKPREEDVLAHDTGLPPNSPEILALKKALGLNVIDEEKSVGARYASPTYTTEAFLSICFVLCASSMLYYCCKKGRGDKYEHNIHLLIEEEEDCFQ